MVLKGKEFNWVPGLFILGYHALLLIGLPIYFLYYTPSWNLLITGTVLMYISGLGVTVGYHRLYSHTTYKLSPVVEGILLFFSTLATQGSAIRWSFDHRYHHSFVDTDKDPYSIKKGFWYAHFLWLFEKPVPIDQKVVADLFRNPLLRFQHRFYGWLMALSNIVVFLFFGWLFNDYLGSFLFIWMVRTFFLHHFTWFINSLAHTWGARPFSKEQSAVDNYVICLLTFGEGYHNYHHTFAKDYRNGIRWYHFDPTKWLIWTLSKVGLARDLKTVSDFHIQEKMTQDRKRLLLEKVSDIPLAQRSEWEQKITLLTDGILSKIQQLKELKQRFGGENAERKTLKMQMRSLKASIRQDYRLTKTFDRHLNTESN